MAHAPVLLSGLGVMGTISQSADQVAIQIGPYTTLDMSCADSMGTSANSKVFGIGMETIKASSVLAHLLLFGLLGCFNAKARMMMPKSSDLVSLVATPVTGGLTLLLCRL